MSPEKKKLIEEIHHAVIEKHKAANQPLMFKTADCAEDEWAGRDMRTGKVAKYKFIPNEFKGGEFILVS